MIRWLQNWSTRRRIVRLQRDLAVLLLRDRAMRTVPGATARDLPDKIVAVGLEISMLRQEITKLKATLK